MNRKPQYKVIRNKENKTWDVVDEHDGRHVASFTVKWEAVDFADEMNEREGRK